MKTRTSHPSSRLFLLSVIFLTTIFCAAEAHCQKLRFAEAKLPRSYIPMYMEGDVQGTEVASLIFSGLIYINKEGRPDNDLASKIDRQSLPGGREKYIVVLEPDARFHGKLGPVTADDIVFTYNALLDPANPNSVRTYLSNLDEVRKIDDSRAEFYFNRELPRNIFLLRYPIIPAKAFEGDTQVPIQPLEKTLPFKFLEKPLGTGPFKVIIINSTDGISFQSNESYYAGKPKLQFIQMMLRENVVSIVDELVMKELDFMREVPFDEFGRVRTSLEFTLYPYESLNYTCVVLNCKNPVLSKLEVRQALDYAIDKTAINDNIFNGNVTPISGPYPVNSWGYNSTVLVREPDLEKAKELLKQAGVTNKNFRLSYSKSKKFNDNIALTIKSNLEAIGITLSLEPLDPAQLTEKCRFNHDFDMALQTFIFEMDPDRYEMFHSSQNEPGQWNFAGFSDPEVDRILEEGRMINEYETRRQLYNKFHRLVHDETPFIFLFSETYTAAVSNSIKDWEVTSSNPFYKIARWNNE